MKKSTAQSSLLINLHQYRRYILKNAWNDLRHRYASTGIGIFWNIIHPLIEIAIYTIVFSLLFSSRTRGMSYRLYVTVGILTWGVFTGTIQRGSNAIIENTRYLKQLNIPSEIFVAKTALAATFLLHIYHLLLMPISIFLGNQVGWKLVLLPLFLVFLQCLAFGMILALSNLQVLFPDIKEMVQAFITLWRWTLPVIYPETILPESIRRWLFLNPPYVFIRSIRRLVLELELPQEHDWIIMIGWLCFMVLLGIIVNRKLQDEVRDAI